MSNANTGPVARRANLASQYKALELQAIPSLFDHDDETQTWSKRRLLFRLSTQHDELDGEVMAEAADDLSKAVKLRREAMTLWPAGTASAKRHWDWIDVLDRMIVILNTPHSINSIQTVEEIASTSLADDNELWVAMDFEIALEQMAQWRRLLVGVWNVAFDNPKEMSIADVATCCLVRYMKSEMAALELSFPEWYDEKGSFRLEILEQAAENDETGLAGELKAIVDSLHQREGLEKMQSALNSAKMGGPPKSNISVFTGDAVRHRNPLIEWMIEIAKSYKENHLFRPEMLIAWRFVLDTTEKFNDGDVARLRSAAVRRLLELQIMARKTSEFLPNLFYEPIFNSLVERIRAMNTYALEQKSLPSFGVIYTWVDYIQTQINSFLCSIPTLQTMAYIYDCNIIIRRQEVVAASPSVEAFCNRYGKAIYFSGRPRDEASWKRAVRDWVLVKPGMKQTQRQLEIQRDEVWVRYAFDHNFQTPREFGFNMTAGTEQWWQAIQDTTRFELQAPSVASLFQKVSKAFGEGAREAMLKQLLSYDWKKQREPLEKAILWYKFEESWFD
ncbi:hypothetical protein GGS24DRAFT_201137 [Hypoxylon argillaceum]|nr:hypothetical protein GGS24DRAFT_201137 [Hypoxylon argillaceum]